jgi:2-iminobutanoate/2-iminopropanoate deaminase
MRTTVTKRILLASMFCIAQFACASSAGRPQKQQTAERGNPMSTQTTNFRLFDPDTMAKPVAGYSQVEVTGDKLVYIAGQVALDKSGAFIGKDDFPAQVEQVFKNLKAAVEAAGGDFNDMIKLNFYCAESVDPALISSGPGIPRDKYANTQSPPVSAFVVVHRLVRAEWLIEVEATAIVKPWLVSPHKKELLTRHDPNENYRCYNNLRPDVDVHVLHVVYLQGFGGNGRHCSRIIWMCEGRRGRAGTGAESATGSESSS